MFEYSKLPFGEMTKHRFYDATTGNGFEVVPEVGGTIIDLWLAQRPIISGCRTPEELNNNQAYKSSLLFPFPNRLDNGEYEHLADHYKFDINEKETQTALHGLGRDVEMDILKKECTDDDAFIKLSYFYEGSEDAYPFPFLVDIEYRISNTNGFTLTMRYTNEAEFSIPVGLGWHPYFQLAAPIDQLHLRLPPCRMVEVNERMLPTGRLMPYEYFNTARPIGKTVLDNAFLLEESQDEASVLLIHNDYSLSYWQESGPGKFRYLQVYTPPDRNTIAIEPMTCNIDAFNNGDGLIMLGPEKYVEARCGLKLKG
jgi:aldose 1-epimerase